MNILDPVDRRRAQNRIAQRRFRERCRQRLSQGVSIKREASTASSTLASASESCSTWTCGDLTLQSEILPDATKDPEHSLFPEHFGSFFIPNNLFSPMPDHSHLSETLQSSSSVDLESRSQLLSLDAPQNALNHGESFALSSGAQRATSLPTASWESPLHIAAQKGHGGIVRLLLEHNIDCNEKDSDGLAPLHIAAQRGHGCIVRLLLEHNADSNGKDGDGLAPLAHAIRGDHETATRLLLSHGARIDYTDGPGCSVFHCAVIHRREALLRLFASYCAADLASLDAFDSEGMTALHRAVATNFEAGVRILLHHGASVHHRARKG